MGLLDDISKLTKPATELPDLEDDNFDGSSLLKSNGNRQKSTKNFNFEEGKYAGIAVSRKEIFGDISEISGLNGKDSDEEDVEDEDMDEEEDVEEDESDVEVLKKNGSLDSEEEQDEEDMDDEEEVESGEDDDDEEEEDSSNLKMTTLSLKDDSDKADKATSVLHQRQVWDDLMYSNIRIHALLNTMNQMPRGESRKILINSWDDSTKKSMENAMENMAKLRDLMKKAVGFFDSKKGTESDDDEEIPSDDEEFQSDFDDEEEGDEDVESDDDQVKSTKNNTGTSVKSLKKNLETLDSSIDKFRSTTVTKWYNRTKILNSKSINNTDFSGFEKGSILGQVNKVLADEEKLLKKVRTNRSGKTRIGCTPDDVDNEIFDDSDFYQTLLKQMIESRNQTNSQDGADMTRSYMELQSMFQNKKKRDVSQLSSKDRKLKYEPIAKLINFYPSKPSVVTWSHESRNELFKSLFS